MNKLFSKIAGVALGLSLAIGVGVALGSGKRAVPAYADDSTATLTISTYATNHSWTGSGGGPYGKGESNALDIDSNVGVYCTGTDSNTGKYYTDWRMYQTGSATVVVFAKTSSYKLTSIKFTYSSNNGGALHTSKSTSVTAYYPSGTKKTLSNVDSVTAYVANTGTATNGQARITAIEVTYAAASQDPITYTSVSVSEKTALTGTYKGEAYYECQAAVTGTGDYSNAVTWSITSSTTYASGTSIASKASIDSNGRITFLDNCTVYVWATAADSTTHNASGFQVVASGLKDNPISTWTKITDDANVSVTKVYALSNDGALFAGSSVFSNVISPTSSPSSIGHVVLESTDGGYYVRFATESAGVWSANGKYIKWANDGTKLSSNDSPDSTYGKWNVVENSTNGVYLKNTSSGRHLGLNEGSTEIRAYAASNLASNVPVYLYESGSLPTIPCDTISLTGKPSEAMSIGDIATLGYYGLDSSANEWTGDVTYTISNEKDASNNATTGVVELSATSGASVTLTAKKAGSARVSVQDDAGDAEADYVDITVLADPARTELPVGNYNVEIDYSSVVKDEAVPASKEYEIKAKEGTGAGRIWYKNMTIAYSNVTASYNSEYTFSKNGSASSATVTTTSETAKVTQVVISYYNSNRLTLTDASSNTIAVSSYTNNVCTYALNSDSFTLSSTSTATSILYIHITFTAADENEEFLSLVVSKSAGWSTVTNGTYKDGQVPTNSGLVVTANYTTDGSTISRSEDVTAAVSNWAYNPSTLSTSDTSFTVIATWGGHNSSAFTVTGISVEAISGDIDAGRYFIISQSGNTLDRVAVTAKACSQGEVTSSASWTFTLVDDDTYTIHATIGGSEKYLTILDDSQGLRTTGTASDLWTVTAVAGGYTLMHNSSNRYLVDYQAAGEQWRTYKSANAEGYNTITLTEEKEAFADNFLDSFTAGCNANGGYTAANMDWSAASTQFATLSTDNQSVFKNASYTKSGTGNNTVVTPSVGVSQKVAEVAARYDYIVGMHGTALFSDFMLREPPALQTANVLNNLLNDSASNTTAIVVISLTSLIVAGGYFFVRRKKEVR